MVAGKHFLAVDGIDQTPSPDGVRYRHLLFAQHQMVFANGMECESFFSGPMAIWTLSERNRRLLASVLQHHNPTIGAYEICGSVLRGRQLCGLHKQVAALGRPVVAMGASSAHESLAKVCHVGF